MLRSRRRVGRAGAFWGACRMVVEHWGGANWLTSWRPLELTLGGDWIGAVSETGGRIYFEYLRLDGSDLQSTYLPGSGDGDAHMARLANGEIVVVWGDSPDGVDLDGRYQ